VTTISAIIPTYNYGRFLRDAIDSALAQTYPPLEVIVVDDGSTDDTSRILAGYGDRIRAIRQDNQGVGAARNTGIAAAKGEYLAFLDSDDLWMQRKLELELTRFQADPALGLVHCGAESFDNDGNTRETLLSGLEGWVAPDLLCLEREVITTPGSGTMVPRRVALEIGGFDPELQPSEDWDFCYRLASRYRVAYVPQVLVRYRLHGKGIHLNIPRMEQAMLKALTKAFRSPDPKVQSLRAQSYGHIHRVLAGCYFQTGKPGKFLSHMMKSLRYDPRNVTYFAAYPIRAASRLFER
jgi:glycosyltransferase involved in cell wall biosynthesis